MGHALRSLVLVVLAAAACSQEAPAPLGEALFVVDTDLPVPQIAGRFRVDLYAADGTWYESRDIQRTDPSSWPASFSVYSPDTTRTTRVIVRLRTYPEGLVRDYRGERFADENGEPADGPSSLEDGPRLFHGDVDATPASEPQPTVAVDRLVLVKLRPGVRGRVRVTLRGACAGTMARLSVTAPYQTPTFLEAQTCTTDTGKRVPLAEEILEDDMSIPPALELGAFARGVACDPANDPRAVCIPGGAFVLGSEAASGIHSQAEATPERVVLLDRFWIDRHEVTVGELRRALADGLASSPDWPAKDGVTGHEGTLGKADPADVYPFDAWCTYSKAAGDHEDDPVNCMTWKGARAACKFLGGDLPSEAQWEYAGAAAGRPAKTDYPWGNTAPGCARAVCGRIDLGPQKRRCPSEPEGPARADEVFDDVTPLGVIGMAGNVSEIVLDETASFTDPCWRTAPQRNPVCTAGTSPSHGLRGGAFMTDPFAGNVSIRNDEGTVSVRALFGFRCAYPTAPGKP